MEEANPAVLHAAIPVVRKIFEKDYNINLMFAKSCMALTEPKGGVTLSATRLAELAFLDKGDYAKCDVKVLTAFAVVCLEQNREKFAKRADAPAGKARATIDGIEDEDAGPGQKGASHQMAARFMQELLKRFYGDKRPIMAELIHDALSGGITVNARLRDATRAAIDTAPINKEFAKAYVKAPFGTVPDGITEDFAVKAAFAFTRECTARYVQEFFFQKAGVWLELYFFLEIMDTSVEAELAQALTTGCAALLKSKETPGKHLSLPVVSKQQVSHHTLLFDHGIRKDGTQVHRDKQHRSREEYAATATCHWCRKTGHLAPDCKAKKDGQPKVKATGGGGKGGAGKANKLNNGKAAVTEAT